MFNIPLSDREEGRQGARLKAPEGEDGGLKEDAAFRGMVEIYELLPLRPK
jgi:hypothetical protein